MLGRHAARSILRARAETPVVSLEGVTQVGKSTLPKALVDDGVLDRLVTLDDGAARSAATADPDGWLGC